MFSLPFSSSSDRTGTQASKKSLIIKDQKNIKFKLKIKFYTLLIILLSNFFPLPHFSESIRVEHGKEPRSARFRKQVSGTRSSREGLNTVSQQQHQLCCRVFPETKFCFLFFYFFGSHSWEKFGSRVWKSLEVESGKFGNPKLGTRESPNFRVRVSGRKGELGV